MNILVTGSTKGIGKVIAKTLSSVGNIYITGRNEQVLKDLSFAKGYFVSDLSLISNLIELGDFVEENSIDVLINNAGEYIYSDIDKIELDKLSHIVDVNLKAPIYLSSRASKYMKKNNFGRIVNIGSISGVMGEASASLYSATKSGLIGFTKATALELAPFGITVNTINPGWVDTELGNESIEDSAFSKEEIMECIPQKRFVEPIEIANLVKYLISEDAKGITGQSINLCAGLSVGY